VTSEHDKPLFEFHLETLVKGFFQPDLFLDYIRYFILFEQDGDNIIKKIAGYHQFHAVRQAVRATVIAAQRPDVRSVAQTRANYANEVVAGSGKAGVVWHTQGSGKSIFMLCYAAKLLAQPSMNNPTIVVVTDRNDLDGQLYNTFCMAQEALKQTLVQVVDRALIQNESAVKKLGDNNLREFARYVTEQLRASATVDWQVRDNVRAKLRNLVRRALKKWKYPPDRADEAIDLCLKQAEVLSQSWVS
jgi:type I site-specific restriction-modification system R (restriction) subunit